MEKIFELAWVGAIVVLAAISAKTERDTPYPVDVCLVNSGPESEDMTTEVWSDMIEQYFERYPGSYCGPCGQERKCPDGD